MFTDAHVVQEGFLEFINNILTVGMVPGLFPEEEKDSLISPLDKEIRVRAAQLKQNETKEFRWNYFVNKARENLHIMLCMSPAGETLKLRCRSFPGLISNSFIDWFFAWPIEALSDVAAYFLDPVELPEDLR
jgi:dynein heavy chain